MTLKLPVKSAIYNYKNLMNNGTSYSIKMGKLRNRIFNEVSRPTPQPALRVVKLFSENPLDLRQDIVNYYPRHPEVKKLMTELRNIGLFRDEHEDFKEEMERLRQLRGKGNKRRVRSKE